jgi:hypothetical protein
MDAGVVRAPGLAPADRAGRAGDGTGGGDVGSATARGFTDAVGAAGGVTAVGAASTAAPACTDRDVARELAYTTTDTMTAERAASAMPTARRERNRAEPTNRSAVDEEVLDANAVAFSGPSALFWTLPLFAASSGTVSSDPRRSTGSPNARLGEPDAWRAIVAYASTSDGSRSARSRWSIPSTRSAISSGTSGAT